MCLRTQDELSPTSPAHTGAVPVCSQSLTSLLSGCSSGSAVMKDGSIIRNGYRLDLDTLTANSRIGMMRCSDATLHYYLDGVDQGVACTDVAKGESITVGR